MTIDQKPILHGRDHMAGGPDPIPGMDADGGGAGGTYWGQRIGTTEDRWYSAGMGVASTNSTNNTVANVLEVFPFVAYRDMTLDRIGIQVTSGVSGNARLGMYTDDGNIYPDALLLDTGTFSISATGPKVTTISQAVTAGTLYWLVCACGPSGAQFRGTQTGDMFPILGEAAWSGTGSQNCAVGWWMAHASAGTLPDPFTAGATPYVTGAVHGNPTKIRVRGIP